jgi:polysaccharide export outer membrane protein
MHMKLPKGLSMRHLATALLIALAAGSVCAQQAAHTFNEVHTGATALNATSDLPIERIGNDDLLGITVYDSPELTRTVRVDSTGEIRLPMLRGHIKAAGLYPADLESSITAALTEEHVLVDPVVAVSVVEYRSHPISVVGAVRTPATFQATGKVTLLDALSLAGGLTENAGPEILVSEKSATGGAEQPDLVRRIPVHGLMDAVNPSLNLTLHGGEEVRVPEAGKFYVLGNVHKPGAFSMTDGSQSTVLKALALAEGLDHFTGHTAYVYRSDGGNGGKKEIEIELKRIIDRKAPDVPLLANDILYVPEATGRKATLTALDRITTFGASIGTTLLYIDR